MKAGDFIKQIRLYRALTQAALGAKLGLTKQRVTALEQADDCNFSTLQAVCAVCDFEIMAYPKELRPPKQSADIELSEPPPLSDN